MASVGLKILDPRPFSQLVRDLLVNTTFCKHWCTCVVSEHVNCTCDLPFFGVVVFLLEVCLKKMESKSQLYLQSVYNCLAWTWQCIFKTYMKVYVLPLSPSLLKNKTVNNSRNILFVNFYFCGVFFLSLYKSLKTF